MWTELRRSLRSPEQTIPGGRQAQYWRTFNCCPIKIRSPDSWFSCFSVAGVVPYLRDKPQSVSPFTTRCSRNVPGALARGGSAERPASIS